MATFIIDKNISYLGGHWLCCLLLALNRKKPHFSTSCYILHFWPKSVLVFVLYWKPAKTRSIPCYWFAVEQWIYENYYCLSCCFDRSLDATVLSICWSRIWLSGRHFVNLSNGLWTNGLFCILHFLLTYESYVVLILICFNITAVA